MKTAFLRVAAFGLVVTRDHPVRKEECVTPDLISSEFIALLTNLKDKLVQ